MKKKHRSDIAFEEALSDNWAARWDIVEVPLGKYPFLIAGLLISVSIAVVVVRVGQLSLGGHKIFSIRATNNSNQENYVPAPRGRIVDRNGVILADNRTVFSAVLDVNAFLHKKESQTETLAAVEDIFGIAANDLLRGIKERNDAQLADPIIVSPEIDQDELVKVRSLNLPSLRAVTNFERQYATSTAFSALLGYTSLASVDDLKGNPTLTSRDSVGKAGIEAMYNKELMGQPGAETEIRDARGRILDSQIASAPQVGATLELSIDAEFQKYFHSKLKERLERLGRTSGAGIAVNPQNGEVLALFSMPSFDNNIFVSKGRSSEKTELLTSEHKPLFNRAVSGNYSPGSTIKPLVGVAALAEGVITPGKVIFSPGYLDIANPYNPDRPTRYLDWRYQGNVDLVSAIAKSSDVYFYEVAGGAPGQRGMGISKLGEWWKKFGLGERSGIDLPGEGKGFLPSPEWKAKTQNRSWLLGDTYNVSIGQGDLLLTPIQLVNYIGAIANGGFVYVPRIAKTGKGKGIVADISGFAQQIKEVQKGMKQAVTSPEGTAYLLHNLPFSVGAKTGSAQVKNNTEENAFFVGYAPYENPQIAIFVLIENSKEGSLNAVPVGRDVLNWYFEHRLKDTKGTSS